MTEDKNSERRNFDSTTLMYTLGRIDGKVDTLIATQGDLVARVKHLEESRAEHIHIDRMENKIGIIEGKLGKLTLLVVAISAGSGSMSAAFLQYAFKVMGN